MISSFFKSPLVQGVLQGADSYGVNIVARLILISIFSGAKQGKKFNLKNSKMHENFLHKLLFGKTKVKAGNTCF